MRNSILLMKLKSDTLRTELSTKYSPASQYFPENPLCSYGFPVCCGHKIHDFFLLIRRLDIGFIHYSR